MHLKGVFNKDVGLFGLTAVFIYYFLIPFVWIAFALCHFLFPGDAIGAILSHPRFDKNMSIGKGTTRMKEDCWRSMISEEMYLYSFSG